MKIIQAPHPLLFQKCQPVIVFDNKLKNLLQDMSKTLIIQHDPDCVGLAANQVGVDLSLFIMRPAKTDPITICINPNILKTTSPSKKTSKSKKNQARFEGCMSLPRIWGETIRADRVLLEYQDPSGKFFKNWFSGFPAQIIQHEVDHLNGILFTQVVISQSGRLYEEKGEDLVLINS